MTIPTGTRVGSYEIIGKIGKGGMGEVYRARDAKLGRDVALKVLPASFARDAERMARFEREAKVLASLNHPNIAAIYGFEDSAGVHALVMELVEGPTLADRIATGSIPVDEALRIARQMADALEYAHERGIVHRDLKPANIKVSRDDAVKILDFGLAKAVEGDASSMDMANSPTLTHMATQAGVLLGTAAYMSPEQAKAKPVDRRADIWAFGCVLYEMLTGKMAFHGETVSDTLAAIIKEEPDWSQLPAATPVRVRVLLQRCLQKDPKQRLRDIGDARISLDEVISGAPEPTSLTAGPARVHAWRRALPWAVSAALAIALAAFAWVRAGNKPAAPAKLVRFEIPVPRNTTLAQDGDFQMSPDGQQLAFFATGADGAMRIYLRGLDSLDERSLPGTESTGSYPGLWWSPDGRRIAFSAGQKLDTIDLSSGVTETLCSTAAIIAGASWNRDGQILFGQYPGGLVRVSASGGTATPVTALESSRGEIAHMYPFFLPDGRHFVYYRASTKPENSGVYIGSLDVAPGKQDLKRLLSTPSFAEYVPSSNAGAGQLLFLTDDGTLMEQPFDARRLKFTGEPVRVAQQVGTPGGTSNGQFSASADGVLAYRASSGGTYQLARYDRQGEVLGAIGEPASYIDLAPSPDESRAAVARTASGGNWALWIVDFSRGISTRFTFGSSDALQPIWSPDGTRIFFASDPSGKYDLYQKRSSGASGEELLLGSNESKFPTDVSRDGHFLLYNSLDAKTSYDIWALPLQGDRKPFPFLRTNFNDTDAHFSPDGRWIAYASDESGRYEVYVRPFSLDPTAADVSGAGAKWQVSEGGAHEPEWSADGKELYYLTLGSKLMEVDVATSPNFQAGTPKLLFQAPQQLGDPTGDYTINGKQFFFLTPGEATGQAPFIVVLNWQNMLKQSQ